MADSRAAMPPERTSPRLGLAAGVVCVSWAAILVRLADAPPLAIASWRMMLAGAASGLFAAVARRRELAPLGRRGWGWLAAAGLALAVHFATWITSLRLTSVASSVA